MDVLLVNIRRFNGARLIAHFRIFCYRDLRYVVLQAHWKYHHANSILSWGLQHLLLLSIQWDMGQSRLETHVAIQRQSDVATQPQIHIYSLCYDRTRLFCATRLSAFRPHGSHHEGNKFQLLQLLWTTSLGTVPHRQLDQWQCDDHRTLSPRQER